MKDFNSDILFTSLGIDKESIDELIDNADKMDRRVVCLTIPQIAYRGIIVRFKNVEEVRAELGFKKKKLEFHTVVSEYPK